jgi:hypothetical protein
VRKLKDSFGLERVVLVGDRGMISHKASLVRAFKRRGTLGDNVGQK